MFGILKKLFAGAAAPQAPPVDPVEFDGYIITPTPIKEPGGWRVGGRIEKSIDGEQRSYKFIRADVCSGVQDTVETSVLKAKRLIQERGEAIFADEAQG
jgi:hypothetical protein